MSWESPNLSKGDVELITIALDEYLYMSDGTGIEAQKIETLLGRLDQHLNKLNVFK